MVNNIFYFTRKNMVTGQTDHKEHPVMITCVAIIYILLNFQGN